MKITIFLNMITLLLFIGCAQDTSDFTGDHVVMPTLLDDSFYKIQDVCMDARNKSKEQSVESCHEGKKAALVLLKTHYCDVNVNVCIDALTALSDPANNFVHQNFITYHSQFSNYKYNAEQGIIWAHYYDDTQKRVGKEWGKEDSNPELLVLRLSDCKVIGKKKIKDYNNGEFFRQPENIDRFSTIANMIKSYKGIEEVLLVEEFNKEQYVEDRKVFDDLNQQNVYTSLLDQLESAKFSKPRIFPAFQATPEQIEQIYNQFSPNTQRGLFLDCVKGKNCMPTKIPMCSNNGQFVPKD
ncbi:hypothetical protein N9N67_04135 [Bacteriovoracaceae bacterium]|nr:hypothetical protein [Bacteriovoracaceae bacterium]